MESKPKRQRRKKKDARNPAESLIKALNFILPVQNKEGLHAHCYIANNWLVGTNDSILMATPIVEDLNACPHTYQFLAALNNCGVGLKITQLDKYSLSVSFADFSAIIPCVDASEIQFLETLPPKITVDSDILIKNAFEILSKVILAKSDKLEYANILFDNNSCIATNGIMLIEFWHGEYIDNGFIYMLSKQLTTILSKVESKITCLGFNNEFITFYLEDGSIISSKTPEIKYPDHRALFKDNHNPWPIPENFFKAIKIVDQFSTDGLVYFEAGKITNGNVFESAYQIEGLPNGMIFDIKSLLLIEPYAKTIEFDTELHRLYFFGDNIRGVIVGYEEPVENKVEEDILF